MSENFDTMNQKPSRQNYFDTIVDEDIETNPTTSNENHTGC